MNETNRQKMEFWLSQHPESTHPLDERRFFDFISSLCESRENVSLQELMECYSNIHPRYEEQSIRNLCEQWDIEISMLKRFYEYLVERRVDL